MEFSHCAWPCFQEVFIYYLWSNFVILFQRVKLILLSYDFLFWVVIMGKHSYKNKNPSCQMTENFSFKFLYFYNFWDYNTVIFILFFSPFKPSHISLFVLWVIVSFFINCFFIRVCIFILIYTYVYVYIFLQTYIT